MTHNFYGETVPENPSHGNYRHGELRVSLPETEGPGWKKTLLRLASGRRTTHVRSRLPEQRARVVKAGPDTPTRRAEARAASGRPR